MSSDDPIILALGDQVACYRRLAKLAGAQHQYVQQSQTERLLEILERRQEVLDQIGVLELALAPAKGRWAAYLDGLPPARKPEVEALLAEKRLLLEAITAADKDDALVLQQRKISLGRQIGQAGTAKAVNRTYATAAYGARPPRMDVQR
jgi:hypothetical protein